MSARSRRRTATAAVLVGAARLAAVGMAIIGCATAPSLPRPGDRVRVWTPTEPKEQKPIVGDIVSLGRDSVRVRIDERAPVAAVAWRDVQALELDTSRNRGVRRFVDCGFAGLGAWLLVDQAADGEADSAPFVLNALVEAGFILRCIAVPEWRTARIPTSGDSAGGVH